MRAQSLHNANEISALLGRTPGKPGDLIDILRHIAHTAQTSFGADACVIVAFNPITGKYIGSQTVVGHVQVENELIHEKLRPERVTQQVLRDDVLLIEDLDAKPLYQDRFKRKEGIRAFAGLALRTRHRKRPLGVIYLDFKHPKKFSSADRESFQIFAGQASFLLQETWLARHYEEVARIGQQVNHNLATVDDLFHELQTYVDAVLDDSHTLLLAMYQPQTNILDVYLREHGDTIFVNTPVQGAYRHVLETQQPWFIQQLSKEVEQLPFHIANIARTEQKESQIFVPLTLRGVSLGVLSIQHSLPGAYGREDQFILQLLASYTALGLHHIRLYSSLSQLNETGQLLTRQLESKQALEATVEKIRDVTQADIVVLYPYEPILRQFVSPPRIAGTLLGSGIKSMTPSRPDDIASLMLSSRKSIFARESATLYTELQGDVRIRQGDFQIREKVCSTAALPLQVGDEVVGVLFVNFRQSQRFDATQKLFIEGLAHYAAIAIKNVQVFGMLSQRRVRELEILQNIDRELNRTLDLKSVLNTFLKLANEQVYAEDASILLYNPRIQALETGAAIGRHAEARRKLIVPLQETRGISRWVMEQKKSARVSNVHSDPQWRDLYIQATVDTVSELDVPLLDGEEVIGVLNFESIREGAFRQEDEDFLLTLAGQAVLAIKNAQAYDREKRFAEEGQVLNEVSKEITSQLDPTHVFDLILEKSLELTHANLCTLMLYDSEQNDLVMVAERGVAQGKKWQRQSLHQGIVGYVARTRRLLNVDPSQSPWNEIYLEFFPGARSELAVPMCAGNDLRGVLNVESPIPHTFDEHDERLLQGLADLAVIALQNAERYEKAERDTQRFELLYKAGQELGKITDWAQLEQAYDIILHIAQEHSECQVVIRCCDDDTQELVLIRASQYQSSPPFPRMKMDEGLNGQVARERCTRVIHDTHNPPPGVVPAKLSDPTTRSLVITPIHFKDQYYGNLGLSHETVGYFRETDVNFFEGLAQQLASTIYRLETAQARKESEQRAKSAEAMSDIGHMAFELTHRWDNELGLVRSYVNDIRSEIEALGVTNTFIAKKLENIVQATRTVLDLSKDLKRELVRSGEAIGGEPIILQSRANLGEPLVIQPCLLFEEVQNLPSLPSTIQIFLEIEEDVAAVRVIHSLVADILRNLVSNAVDAMPEGGKITLRAHNAGSFVALEVTDTGIGIPQQSLAKIFDLFYSTKGSSGFGLWSARRNALRNHGDLTVKSEVGQGTTFTLLLPRVEGGTT